jgi:hypothetical protein
MAWMAVTDRLMDQSGLHGAGTGALSDAKKAKKLQADACSFLIVLVGLP